MRPLLRFFRSMAFGMLLLVLVMLLSLAGSLIPQQQSPMDYVRRYGADAASWLVRLGLTDVFHSLPFRVLELLLCINLLLCSLVRLPSLPGKAAALRRAACTAAPAHSLGGVPAEDFRKLLLSRRFRARTEGDCLIYVRSPLGIAGSSLVHLSILLVLLFGTLTLTTPTVEDRTVLPGKSLTLPDGTCITCESFHIEDARGNLDYASRLRVTDAKGSLLREADVRVNAPLAFGPYRIYQQTCGTAGQVRILNHANGAGETVPLTESCFLSIDGQNGIFFNALYPGYVEEEDGSITLITSTSGSYPDPVYDLRSITSGMSASVLAFPGDDIRIGDITFTFLSPLEYPGLRIKRTEPLLYAGLYLGFALMVAGLYLCFFAVPVFIRVEQDAFALVCPKSPQGILQELRAGLSAVGRPDKPKEVSP